MEIKRFNSREYILRLSLADEAHLEHYAGIAGVCAEEFIVTAMLMHMVSYRRCSGYEPDMSTIGKIDDKG